MKTTNVERLIINKMTKEQYDAAKESGTLNDNELYLTPEEEYVNELPTVTTSDNGKFLRVVSGVWAAATVPVMEGGTY